jgi:hypothetical protein
VAAALTFDFVEGAVERDKAGEEAGEEVEEVEDVEARKTEVYTSMVDTVDAEIEVLVAVVVVAGYQVEKHSLYL